MPRPKKPPPEATQKATVISIARVKHSRSAASAQVDEKILKRTKECLARANHPTTPEFEARTAWRMASRLMSRYNLTQADLVARATKNDNLAQIGGESVVSITTRKIRVVTQTFVRTIAWAMSTLFDCCHYSTARASSIDWTFYGIAANTIPAAMGFEMAHNLALEWARYKQGGKHDYCMGIGDGLLKIVEDEKKAELKQAQNAEKRAKKAEKSRAEARGRAWAAWMKKFWRTAEGESLMSGVKLRKAAGAARGNPIVIDADNDSDEDSDGDSDEDSDGDSDEDSDEDIFDAETTFKEADDTTIDLNSSFEDQLRKLVSKHSKTQLTVWKASQALVQFRKSAKQVAEDYLKEKNVKLGKMRKPKPWTTKRPSAYAEGVEDSKDIDVKRRRIK